MDDASAAREGSRIAHPCVSGSNPVNIGAIPSGRGDQRIITVRNHNGIGMFIDRLSQATFNSSNLAHSVQLIS